MILRISKNKPIPPIVSICTPSYDALILVLRLPALCLSYSSPIVARVARRSLQGTDRAASAGRIGGGFSRRADAAHSRSEEHTSELQSLMRISYAVFCLTKQKKSPLNHTNTPNATPTY